MITNENSEFLFVDLIRKQRFKKQLLNIFITKQKRKRFVNAWFCAGIDNNYSE
jgi:hypothetical protein